MTYRDGRVMNFLAKPILLQLLKDIGLDKGYVPSEIIYSKIKNFNGLPQRLGALKDRNYIVSRQGKKSDGSNRKFDDYRLSGMSMSYLKKYGSFINPEGWLIKKEREIDYKNKEQETKDESEIKEIIVKEVERVKEINNPIVVTKEKRGYFE